MGNTIVRFEEARMDAHPQKFQDLSLFRVPRGFRGRPAWFVQLWWIVQSSLFKGSPQFAYRYRAWLLRLFGAQIGRNTVIRPSVSVTYPWKLSIGDYAQVGDDVTLYTLGRISIGAHSVVSQRSYLCAADHDLERAEFPLRERPITVGNECWIAADVFVGPEVSIGDGTVIGARSSVFCSVPSGCVAYGSPCRVVRSRSSTRN